MELSHQDRRDIQFLTELWQTEDRLGLKRLMFGLENAAGSLRETYERATLPSTLHIEESDGYTEVPVELQGEFTPNFERAIQYHPDPVNPGQFLAGQPGNYDPKIRIETMQKTYALRAVMDRGAESLQERIAHIDQLEPARVGIDMISVARSAAVLKTIGMRTVRMSNEDGSLQGKCEWSENGKALVQGQIDDADGRCDFTAELDPASRQVVSITSESDEHHAAIRSYLENGTRTNSTLQSFMQAAYTTELHNDRSTLEAFQQLSPAIPKAISSYLSLREYRGRELENQGLVASR